MSKSLNVHQIIPNDIPKTILTLHEHRTTQKKEALSNIVYNNNIHRHLFHPSSPRPTWMRPSGWPGSPMAGGVDSRAAGSTGSCEPSRNSYALAIDPHISTPLWKTRARFRTGTANKNDQIVLKRIEKKKNIKKQPVESPRTDFGGGVLKAQSNRSKAVGYRVDFKVEVTAAHRRTRLFGKRYHQQGWGCM